MARFDRRRLTKPLHPNVGIAKSYERQLDALVEQMHASLIYWLTARWRSNPPVIAQDASPVNDLLTTMRVLGRRWRKNFDDAAPKFAEHFAKQSAHRVNTELEKILEESGMQVDFTYTNAMRDAMQATVGQNVGLIKSIASEHLSKVEGSVMRAVAQGGDLQALARELRDDYGVTKKRAAFIAHDQGSKANSVLTRTRMLEAGLGRSVWLHSGGGKHPRPSHVAYDGREYDTEKGAFIDGEWIHPGDLINCRCVAVAVIPGL